MAPKKKKAAKKKASSSLMELTEVRCSVGMTIPTGDYSNFRIDVGASARHPDGRAYTRKEFDTVYDKLTNILQTKIEEAAEEMRQDKEED